MNDKEIGLELLKILEVVNQKIIDNPTKRRKYILIRGHIEKALKQSGNGIVRTLNRPPSVPIVSHTLKDELQQNQKQSNSDILADNAPEPTVKKTRSKK